MEIHKKRITETKERKFNYNDLIDRARKLNCSRSNARSVEKQIGIRIIYNLLKILM